MATVVLVGTLDTKRDECAWIREEIEHLGHSVLVIDVGTFSDSSDDTFVSSEDVAQAGGANLSKLREAGDRGAAMTTMAEGAAIVARRLFDDGKLDGMIALGGSSGSSVAAAAMQILPVGVPKVLVSTMVSGDVSAYVGAKDIVLMPSIVDIAGINRISRTILGNAAAAIAGMSTRYALRAEETSSALTIAATMFGVTTPAVEEARARLEELGYEVLVFHATGAGGTAMESLVDDGLIDGVIDLTTTELVDDLVGGVLSAGPGRLEAAGHAGIPQVVSLGALDMCNFGPRDTVPEKFADRILVVHNPTVTLMRSTPAENAELGRRIGSKLAKARGPVAVFVPERGFSALDVEGQPFFDPAADKAAIDGMKDALNGSAVRITELDMAINDSGFGRAAADALHELISNPRKGNS
ncbi:Tm-1-like ATP-binding domain-containing protein [Microbacterium azadirachtae]|uniref:Uncharacterized protein n=1 Tax=Microbacterium azadirachtae TaxID=582680 RepID=A0A0F0LKU8_9MICO|nr:Tm-1-like ATP-binding domain-containing protein [Microbacterium azadirachtae]KJL32166.1 hypothetical protein RS86_02635 [Microbacterium azadirachtae]